MGYRNSIGLAIANYKKLPERVKDALYEIFMDPEYIDSKKKTCLFISDGLTWEYIEPLANKSVVTVTKWMNKNEHLFKFVRIGEDDGDIETLGSWKDPFHLGFSRRLEYKHPDQDRTQVGTIPQAVRKRKGKAPESKG